MRLTKISKLSQERLKVSGSALQPVLKPTVNTLSTSTDPWKTDLRLSPIELVRTVGKFLITARGAPKHLGLVSPLWFQNFDFGVEDLVREADIDGFAIEELEDEEEE